MTGGRIDYVPGHDHVNFTNGSRILSLPNNPAACRGFTAECVCLDEAAFIENLDEVIQAIAPTLTRNPDAEFVMTSTPAGKNGKFYELYQAALMDPEWEVQTTTIHDAINDGFKADLESLRQLCPDPDVFAQEYECVFQDEYGAWLDPEDLVFDDIDDFNGPWWLGLDVGVRRDASGLAAAYEKNGRLNFARLDYLRNMKFEEQFQAVKAFCS